MKLRVACVQFSPVIGQVEANVQKVWKLLQMSKRDEFDLVMLPELAVTGYNFTSPRHVEPYLESVDGAGPSVSLAREISRKYKCFTVMGYPETLNSSGTRTTYNSAVLVGPHGKVLQNYRKTFLYETDEVWGSSENPVKGFPAFDLVLDKEYYLEKNPSKEYNSVKTSMGICMDLNPYKFEAPFNAFEYSMSCYRQGVKLMLCPMAWLSPQSPSIKEELTEAKKREAARELESHMGSQLVVNDKTTENKIQNTETFIAAEPSMSTLDYWIVRFFPYLFRPYIYHPETFKFGTLITCNRVGVESTVVYTGTSSIIQFHNGPTDTTADSTNTNVDVIGSLGQGEEAILLREIDID